MTAATMDRAGLWVLVRLNADRLLAGGALAACLALGAAIGGLMAQQAGAPAFP